MEWIIAIIAICTIGSLANNWIRARHGYPLKDENGAEEEWSGLSFSNKEFDQLKQQNRVLTEQLENTQDRVAVLERIVTDQGYSTARQIEALRDLPEPVADKSTGSGVPLNVNREKTR